MTSADSAAAALSVTLARLVVKDGVGLGGLATADRALALGVVWAALPDSTASEAEINQRLKQALAGPACWLATDHVELRRWLVDTGWLSRDGFGRAYVRVAAVDLPAPLHAAAAALAGLDITAWVAQARQRHQDERAARQQAWRRQA